MTAKLLKRLEAASWLSPADTMTGPILGESLVRSLDHTSSWSDDYLLTTLLKARQTAQVNRAYRAYQIILAKRGLSFQERASRAGSRQRHHEADRLVAVLSAEAERRATQYAQAAAALRRAARVKTKRIS